MTTAPDEREPEGYANYPGDVRGTFDAATAYGPGYDGEWRFAVDAEYDEATGRTRVGFTRVPPPGVDLSALARTR